MLLFVYYTRVHQTRRSGRLFRLGFNEIAQFLSKSEVLVTLSVFSSRGSLKRWPMASKIMDGPVKMNTEWSVWPVHVLGPVGPAFFNRHSPTLVCFYSIRNVLPCCDENRKTEIITNQIFHFLVLIFRFAVSLSGDCRSRRNR